MSDAIIVAIITVVGGSFVGSSFALAQFLLKLKFDKQVRAEDRADKKDERFEALREEFQLGLTESEATAKKRFDYHAKLIEENTKSINELVKITKEQSTNYNLIAAHLSSMNKYTKTMGEGVKSVLYDKIIIITDRCLARCDGGAITAEEQANVDQLYQAYAGLDGNGEGKVRHDAAMEKMRLITQDEAVCLDLARREKCRVS